MQHQAQIMDPSGHTTITWDPEDPESVDVAEATFDEMTAKGYSAFRVTEGKGEKLKSFDPSAEKMILVPQLVGG